MPAIAEAASEGGATGTRGCADFDLASEDDDDDDDVDDVASGECAVRMLVRELIIALAPQ